jgi:hypothetical protein
MQERWEVILSSLSLKPSRPDRTTGFRERSFETSSILFPRDDFLTALDRLPSCHRPRIFVAEVHEDERNRLLYMPHSARSCRIMPVSEHSPSKSSENGTVSKMENGTEIGFSWHYWSPPDGAPGVDHF